MSHYNVFKLFFIPWLILNFVFPSGFFLGLNLKFFSLPFFSAYVVLGMLNGFFLIRKKELVFNGFLACFLISYYAFGMFNDFDIIEINAEFKMIVSTWYTFALTFIFLRRSKRIAFYFPLIVFQFSIVYFVGKILISLIGFYLGSGALIIFEVLFNVSSPVWEILPGLERVQYVNDLTVLLLFFVCGNEMLRTGRLRLKTFQALSFICLVALVISYSRFLFILFVVLGFLLVGCYRRGSIVKLGIFGLVIAAIFVGAFPGIFGIVSDAVLFRFDGNFNFNSDYIRALQFNGLIEMWWESPIFGHGMGAYNVDVLRGKELGRYFLYEMQWLSLLMKFGLVGIIPLTSFILYYLYTSFDFDKKDTFVPFFAVVFFILSGFTNPYLFSSSSGFFLAVTVFILNRRTDTNASS